MNYEPREVKLRRQRTKKAIDLAVKGRWEEAVEANRSVIEVFPNDLNAYNRMGKALTELGQYQEAMNAYSRALEINPSNSIAKKNLRRLSLLKETQPAATGGNHAAAPEIFVEDSGKAGLVTLEKLAAKEVLAKMAAGDRVYLRPRGQGLSVENTGGEYLGQLEPKIGVRLAKLIEGGNGYTAAIARITDEEAKIIVKEIYQHPSQAGLPSFPAQDFSGFRAYIRDSILKYELDDEEGADDRSYHVEEIEPAPIGDASLLGDAEEHDEMAAASHALSSSDVLEDEE